MSQYTPSPCIEGDDFADHAAGDGGSSTTAHPELGECLAAYRGSVSRNASWLMSLVSGTVVAFGLLGYMIHCDGFCPPDHGLAFGQFAMAALGVVCIALLIRAIRNANSDLLLFEHGLIARRSRELHQFKWDDVESVIEDMSVTTYNHGVATQTKHHLHVRLCDRREIKLDLSSIPNSEEASGIVASATVPRLVSQTQATLATGQVVDFGFVKLSADGLQRPSDPTGAPTLGWRDIAEFDIADGCLTIKALKGWKTWACKPLDEIPNFRVLVAFLEHHRNGVPLGGAQAGSQELSPATIDSDSRTGLAV